MYIQYILFRMYCLDVLHSPHVCQKETFFNFNPHFLFDLWSSLILTSLFSDIVDIKPANMEELTEVITAAEFHPNQCNTFVYSSSKGTIRLCDMRTSALCDKHSKSKCSLPAMSLVQKLNDGHARKIFVYLRTFLIVCIYKKNPSELTMNERPVKGVDH